MLNKTLTSNTIKESIMMDISLKLKILKLKISVVIMIAE